MIKKKPPFLAHFHLNAIQIFLIPSHAYLSLIHFQDVSFRISFTLNIYTKANIHFDDSYNYFFNKNVESLNFSWSNQLVFLILCKFFLFLLMMSLEKEEVGTHQLTHIMYFLWKPLETKIIHVCMSNHDIKENTWCTNVHICNMSCCLNFFTQWLMQILLQWELLYIFPITWVTTCELSILSTRNNSTIDYKYYFHTL